MPKPQATQTAQSLSGSGIDNAEDRRARSIQRVLSIGLVLTGVAAAAGIGVSAGTGAWQSFAAAALILLSGLSLFVVRLLMRRGRIAFASYLMVSMVVVLFPLLSLLWEGAGLVLIVGMLSLTISLGDLVWGRRGVLWVGLAGLFSAVLIVLLDRTVPWVRFAISSYVPLAIFVYGTVGTFALLAVLRLVRAYRDITTIRMRLLITMVLVVLMVAGAVSIGSIIVGLRNARQQAFRQLESVATLKRREINTWVRDLKLDLEAVITEAYEVERARSLLTGAYTIEYRTDAEVTLRLRFGKLIERTQRFEELFLLDLDGLVVLSTDPTQEGKLDTHETYFQRGRQEPYVHPPSFYPTLGDTSVVVAQPLYDAFGDQFGVLAGRASLTGLNEIMVERTGLGESGETYLVGADHTLVTDSRYGLEEGLFVRSDGIDAVLTDHQDGQSEYNGYQNVPVLGYYAWVPDLEVALIAEQGQDEVTRGAQVMILVNAGVAVTAVLLAIVGAAYFTQTISRPLAHLSATSTRIASGDRDLVVGIERADEIGSLARAFNSMTAQLRELIGSLEQRVAEATRNLETAVDVSRIATAMLDPAALQRRVVELVQQRFGLYYVGLFLLDETGTHAVLRAGTGEFGRVMLMQGHRLAVDSRSMIGRCVNRNQYQVAQDVEQGVVRFANPLLPDTRSELALPMRSRGRVVGAMTVQSEHPAAFEAGQISVLQAVADQVAVAIDNARNFAEMQAALAQTREVQRHYLGQAWREYVSQQQVGGYEYDRQSGAMVAMQPARDVPVIEVEDQIDAREPVRPGDEPLIVSVMQGDNVVARLGLERRDRAWDAQDVALARAVAEQLGLSIETQRLLDATQMRAAREQLTLRISEQVRGAFDVEEILRIATRSLGQELNASEVVVRLGTEHKLLGESDD